ncbi:uncharacterized protein LOC112493651 isoform X2 [Cephus cinctus]|uniref:Uncharacterized protein LOC112493651 isoform X2 n=1 Tax=Cephus cinctus TaxID=211228 RepID=A0AAJ7VWH8_CEPCN|nr:uncharacterized protein LOC112493651 isoform X2 [Cephus cinctus]
MHHQVPINLNYDHRSGEPRMHDGLGIYPGTYNSDGLRFMQNDASIRNSKSLTALAQLGIYCLQEWYENSCLEVSSAVHEIRSLWITTSGTCSKKITVANRQIAYYLIILSIYLIETVLWIDKKLFQGLLVVLFESHDKRQMLIGLGIVVCEILFLYVIGSPYSYPHPECDATNEPSSS